MEWLGVKVGPEPRILGAGSLLKYEKWGPRPPPKFKSVTQGHHNSLIKSILLEYFISFVLLRFFLF